MNKDKLLHWKRADTVIVLAVTSQLQKARLPTHVLLPAAGRGLERDSVALAEQLRTLDKRRLRARIGQVTPGDMAQISQALAVSLGL